MAEILEDSIMSRVNSFLSYLEIESAVNLTPQDRRYDVIRYRLGGGFQILERTEDIKKAIAVADFNTTKTSNERIYVYSPHGDLIYIGKEKNKVLLN